MDIPKESRRRSHAAIKPHKPARQATILAILNECGDMTAQEVAAELHRRSLVISSERNFAAPRLTELYKAGKVRPAGKKICDRTGRSVTVWTARQK